MAQVQGFLYTNNVNVPIGTTQTVTVLTVPPDATEGKITSIIYEVKPSVNSMTMKILDRGQEIPYFITSISGSFSTPIALNVDIPLRPNSQIQAVITNTSATVDLTLVLGVLGYYVR
jgi:hypothetical protein